MATQCEIDTYINERLEDQIKWYDQKSSSNQNRFKKCKWAEMALGGIIAVLTPAITNCELIKYIIAASSAGIVILVALHGLHNFHENWIEYRKTSELLKNEKYTYLNKAGVYKELSDDERFILLVERCESIISHENINWANMNSGSTSKK
ncbi:DUF4231 domain-containing protein [Veillonella tobetsuensis]